MQLLSVPLSFRPRSRLRMRLGLIEKKEIGVGRSCRRRAPDWSASRASQPQHCCPAIHCDIDSQISEGGGERGEEYVVR